MAVFYADNIGCLRGIHYSLHRAARCFSEGLARLRIEEYQADALNLVALFFQENGRDRRIDAAAHADDDFFVHGLF